MGLLRFLAIGAAVAVGVNYLTKKRPDGTSVLDDLAEKAPEWINQAKAFGDRVKERYSQYSSGPEDPFARQSETQNT